MPRYNNPKKTHMCLYLPCKDMYDSMEIVEPF